MEASAPVPPRIFLWCVPRSCSTVFTNFMSYIDGAEVWFEPYVLSWVNKFNWFDLIEKKEVGSACKKIVEEIGDSIQEEEWGNMRLLQTFSYESTKAELEREPRNGNPKFLFIKDMAFAIDGHYKYFPAKVPCRHVFLIRHPHRFLSSYRRHCKRITGCSPEEEYKHGASDMLIQGGKCKDQIFELWKYIRENVEPNPVVMDTDDMLENPGIILPKLFARLSIPWKESYLSWESKGSIVKKWIACVEQFDRRLNQGCFDRALFSTNFIPCEQPVPSRNDLHPDIAKYVDKFMPGYKEMLEHAIQQ
ncbi:hypothetical protein HOLleu_36189 [Holothuria leucospilota]|uniref:Sulfotransferase n=1 Tax=Holothuria leucospilota TaxID=206669 RepID=A0A9Q0YLS7_HOLLE|nr:hypothetical protein HOLleu_36189 [Holothuria leucospilota]